MRRTDRRACTAATPPPHPDTQSNAMQNEAQKHAVAQSVGLDICVAHLATSATRAISLYNMIELRTGSRAVSQGRPDARGWLAVDGLCYICEIGHLRVPSTKLRKEWGGSQSVST